MRPLADTVEDPLTKQHSRVVGWVIILVYFGATFAAFSMVTLTKSDEVPRLERENAHVLIWVGLGITAMAMFVATRQILKHQSDARERFRRLRTLYILLTWYGVCMVLETYFHDAIKVLWIHNVLVVMALSGLIALVFSMSSLLDPA